MDEDSKPSTHDGEVKTSGEETLLAKRRRSSEGTKPASKKKRRNSRNSKLDGKGTSKKHKKRGPAELTFHLGGSINDPLNLEGLSGSGHDCTTCPPSPTLPQQQPSPLPPHMRRDPLNLEGTVKESKKSHSIEKHRKRKRSKSQRTRSVSKGPEQGEGKAILSDDAFQATSAMVVDESRIKTEDQQVSIERASTSTSGIATSGSNDDTSSVSAKVQKGKGSKFRYGNYTRYYGYRNNGSFASDSRLKLMKKEWFEGKVVLDIGCNTGQVTIEMARTFNPKKICGTDIDEELIRIAKKNVIRVIPLPSASSEGLTQFPQSFSKVYGPIAVANNGESSGEFPNNISFKQENFVPPDDASMTDEEPRYHVILALSLTKWIHLNWGDSGIKRMFRRVYSSLLPGGMFILEPQPFSTYAKKRYLTHKYLRSVGTLIIKPRYTFKRVAERRRLHDLSLASVLHLNQSWQVKIAGHVHKLCLSLSNPRQYSSHLLIQYTKRVNQKLTHFSTISNWHEGKADFVLYTEEKHEIFQNYSNISFKPEEFGDYLLGPEVGFAECLPLGVPENPSKGFQRPLELYIKADAT